MEASVLSLSSDDIRLFLHVLAATIWVGGQITLAALVPVLRTSDDGVTAKAARQFNRIAWPAFAVLVITGIWNMAATPPHQTADYDMTLQVKMGVVLLSGVAAFVHLRAKSKKNIAVWGALSGLSALAALLVGVMLGNGQTP
jgi:putative copper export protein